MDQQGAYFCFTQINYYGIRLFWCLLPLSGLTKLLMQVGKHGIIIEFTDPDNNTRRSATYLPEVAANEGNNSRLSMSNQLGKLLIPLIFFRYSLFNFKGCKDENFWTYRAVLIVL